MDLHVVIVPDSGNSWFGQGIEWDYAAAGTTIEELKENFMIGLNLTMELHMKKFGRVILNSMPIPEMEAYGVLNNGTLTDDRLSKMRGFLWTVSIDIPGRQ